MAFDILNLIRTTRLWNVVPFLTFTFGTFCLAALPQDSSPVRFSYVEPANGSDFRSPFHKQDGTDNFVRVTSKYNQPRDVRTTNPHEGVDLQAPRPFGNDIHLYPPAEGKVVCIDLARGAVIIRLSDSDGDLGNLYSTYLHLKEVGVELGRSVNAGEEIGTYGNAPKGQSDWKCIPGYPEPGALDKLPDDLPVHLHFELNTFLDSVKASWVSVPLSPFYRNIPVRNWNHGYDLDFIVEKPWNGRTIEVVVYAIDDGKNEGINQGDVILWHRRSGDIPWQSTALQKEGDNWSYDLSAKYQSGEWVEMIVSAKRSSLDSSPKNIYKHSFWLPKYYRPALDPNEIKTGAPFFKRRLSY